MTGFSLFTLLVGVVDVQRRARRALLAGQPAPGRPPAHAGGHEPWAPLSAQPATTC